MTELPSPKRTFKTKRGQLSRIRTREPLGDFPARFNALVDEINRLAAICKRLLRKLND